MSGGLVADMMENHDQAYVMLDSDPDLIARVQGAMGTVRCSAMPRAVMRWASSGSRMAPAVVLTMDEPVLAQKAW